MDFERAFKFIWEDIDWLKKIGIAAALSFTVIGILAVVGWTAEIARRVAANEEEPLPSWDDLGKYFISGLKFIGVIFVWALPVALIVVLFSVLIFVSASIDNAETISRLMTILSACFAPLFMILMLGFGFLAIPLLALLGEGRTFGELVNPKHAWTLLRANFGGYILAVLVGWLITMLLSPIGSVACGVGAFFTTVLTQAFQAHLIGQATAHAKGNLELQPAVEPV